MTRTLTTGHDLMSTCNTQDANHVVPVWAGESGLLVVSDCASQRITCFMYLSLSPSADSILAYASKSARLRYCSSFRRCASIPSNPLQGHHRLTLVCNACGCLSMGFRQSVDAAMAAQQFGSRGIFAALSDAPLFAEFLTCNRYNLCLP